MKPFNKDRALAGDPVRIKVNYDDTLIAHDFKEYIVGDKTVLSCLVDRGGQPYCVLLVDDCGRILSHTNGDAAQISQWFALYMTEREVIRYINVYIYHSHDVLVSELTYATAEEAKKVADASTKRHSDLLASYTTLPVKVRL